MAVMPGPVTVSVTRHVDPSQKPEMLAWLQAGSSLAEKFEGFLGAGWVRPAEDSAEWHMLYRFADDESLEAWEASPQRAWWLAAGEDRIELTRIERRTGIEGWFDEPQHRDIRDLRVQPPPPPRWKQALVIFLVFYPLSVVVNWLSAEVGADALPLLLRVLLVIAVMTPTMTYLALPWVTRRMEWFLQGQPPPWRRQRG